MARPRNHQKHLHSAVEGLVASMNGLLDTLGAAGPHLPVEMRHAPGETAPKKRGPGKGNPKLKAALKAYWAKMKGKARASRIAKMLKGRGLKPKGTTPKKATAKRPASPKPANSKGGAWASMSREQRAERIAKMRAGRTQVAT